MRYRTNFLLLALLGFALSSCEDVIDIELPESEPQLVVEGFITDQAWADNYVQLSLSGPYDQSEALPPLSGAQVVLFDENSPIDTLTEKAGQAGYYPITEVGIAGKIYYLEITTPTGETYRTQPERLQAAPPIDSIFARKNPFNDPDEDEEEYNIFLTATDVANERNFYRWKLYQNGLPLLSPENLVVSDDVILDGRQVVGFQVNRAPFYEGDSVRADQLSLTEAYFGYLSLLAEQTAFPGGIFDTPPAPLRGNVYRIDDPDQLALGYFAATGISSSRMVVSE